MFISKEATTRGVLWKKVFFKISQISQENTFNQSLFFIKVAGLRPATLSKRDSDIGVFLWILRIFKNTFFTENLQTTASVSTEQLMV